MKKFEKVSFVTIICVLLWLQASEAAPPSRYVEGKDSLDPRLSSNWPRFQRFLEGKFASERMPANRPHYPMMHSTFQDVPFLTEGAKKLLGSRGKRGKLPRSNDVDYDQDGIDHRHKKYNRTRVILGKRGGGIADDKLKKLLQNIFSSK